MFLRKRKREKGVVVDILAAYRNKEGKPTNRQVGRLGPFDSLDDSRLKELGEKLLNLSSPGTIALDSSAREISRKVIGSPMVVRRLWKELKLERVLKKIARKHQRLELNLNKAVLLCVVQRLVEPASKLRTHSRRDKLAGNYEVELQHLYRALDILADEKTHIERSLFDARRDLFNNSIDMVFFDTTTFYFDSQKAGALLRKGYSKDGKFADVQIVFGMMTDKLGQPIGYEYFPGNTHDVKTLLPAVRRLKEEFHLGDVTIVGDSGVLSKSNLKELDKCDYRYIVAAKLKQLPAEKKKEILQRERYHKFGAGEEEIWLYETLFRGRRLIVTWSDKRARKDAHEREELLKKLEAKLEEGEKGVLTPRYRKFVEVKGVSMSLKPKAIEDDAAYDGFLGVITNNAKLEAPDAVKKYKELWKIEESFRMMKSQLEVRPMFHWTEKRISGHLVMCFLCFAVLRELERRARVAGIKESAERMLRALSELQASEIESGGGRYLLRSVVPPLAGRIFKALRLRMPVSFTQTSRESEESYLPIEDLLS